MRRATVNLCRGRENGLVLLHGVKRMRNIKGQLIKEQDFGPFGKGCIHAVIFPGKCIGCYYLGQTEMKDCDDCGAMTWHLYNQCLRAEVKYHAKYL